MRKTIRIIVWVLAALVVAAAGLLAYLRDTDLSAYQGRVETFLSSKIGHQFNIGGRFELYVGATTLLVAEDVSLTNPDWKSDSTLGEVGHITLAFNTWSVFSGPFVVEKLQVRDIRVRLERSEEGRLNWLPNEPKVATGEAGSFDPRRVAFRQVEISRAHFSYVDAGKPNPNYVDLEYVTVNLDSNDVLDLDLRGDVNGLPLWADGKLGPWQNFIGGKEIFADLDVTFGQASLELNGTVADMVGLDGVELNGALSGPEISVALERLGLPPFAAGPFEITAEIKSQVAAHQVRVDGNLGQIVVFSSGNMDSLLNPRVANHDFSVSGPDAHYVAEIFGIEGVSTSEFQISGDYRRDGRLIGFNNALLRVGPNSIAFAGELDISNSDVNGELEVSASGPDFSVLGPFISMSGLPADEFRIDGRLQKDGTTWRANNVEAVIGNNRISADGSITTGSSELTEITLHAEGPDISILQDFTELQGIPARPYDMSARIRSDPLGINVVEGKGDFGGNQVWVGGVVAVESGLSGTSLSLRATGPELLNIALLSGVPYLPAGPYDVSGDIRINGGALFLHGAEATVGELTGSASGSIGLGAALGQVDLDITLSGSDASKLASLEVLEPFSGEKFDIAGHIQLDGERLESKSLRISVGDLQSEISGFVIGPGTVVDIDFAARSRSSEALRKLAKLGYLPAGEMILAGKVKKSETSLYFSGAEFRMGEIRASADGQLSLSPRSNDSDLTFSIAGPSLLEIGRVFDKGFLPDKSFDLSGHFNGTPAGFTMSNFQARIDDSNLRGDFDVDLTGKPRLVGTLSSTLVDLSDSLERAEQADVSQRSGSDGSKFVFPDDPLNTSMLQMADINLDLRFDRLVANTINVNDVHVSIHISDGALDINPIHLGEDEGSIDGRFTLTPVDGKYRLDANLAVDDMHIGLLVPGDQDYSKLPAMRGQVQIQGEGDSVHSIMASSNGVISFRQGPGLVREVFGSVIFRDLFLEVLRTLNPLRKYSEYQKLECSIFDVSIKAGIASIDKFAIQTDRMTTVASGQIDLGSEELGIGFRAKPREGIGISLGTVANQMLELRGTLKSPRIRVDAGKTATTTGAAVATGGLSLLARGMWDRLSAEANICEEDGEKP